MFDVIKYLLGVAFAAGVTYGFMKYGFKSIEKKICDLESDLNKEKTRIDSLQIENNKYFQEELRIKRRLEKKLDLIDMNLALLMRESNVQPITSISKNAGVDG